MIQTFIFFDLETTGLITGSLMPKITELSMIAVSRDALCNSKESLPRVLHKVVLPIYPNRSIPKPVQLKTDLCNENLEDVSPFDCEVYDIVVNFLKRLAMPACFVAYNGNVFDYPIFLWELRNINKGLDTNVLSIDMLYLIKDFFSDKGKAMEQVNIPHNIPSTPFMSEDFSILLNDGCDDILLDALDSVMKGHLFEYKFHTTSCNSSTSLPPKKHDNICPNRSNSMLKTSQTNCFKKMQEINEKTPDSHIVKLDGAKLKFQGKGQDARRRLDFTSGRPPNFKLTSVHEHILGAAPEHAHTAEGDCLSMLRCASQLGNFFVEWADCNAVPLHTREKKC